MEGVKNTNLIEAIKQLADSKDKGWQEKKLLLCTIHWCTIQCGIVFPNET